MDIYNKKHQKDSMELKAKILNRELRKFYSELEKCHLLSLEDIKNIKLILKQ